MFFFLRPREIGAESDGVCRLVKRPASLWYRPPFYLPEAPAGWLLFMGATVTSMNLFLRRKRAACGT